MQVPIQIHHEDQWVNVLKPIAIYEPEVAIVNMYGIVTVRYLQGHEDKQWK